MMLECDGNEGFRRRLVQKAAVAPDASATCFPVLVYVRTCRTRPYHGFLLRRSVQPVASKTSGAGISSPQRVRQALYILRRSYQVWYAFELEAPTDSLAGLLETRDREDGGSPELPVHVEIDSTEGRSAQGRSPGICPAGCHLDYRSLIAFISAGIPADCG
ncbi:hypothetical protein BDP81DRAFT_48366 [Colletotrichum phormii]|uniref:Uncharacterized protein n=1 Tax=Colletotrichum phormii TaxID=359342 RepID=A0AAJ0EDS2_9PEZI|nr:uncharacterized protein BDP81DRAFT_48366 [Colletotrichum phormii]KAK1635304.1 hypothetical protein BDP81DRAFT_48366 [Colletotrichum phormii]